MNKVLRKDDIELYLHNKTFYVTKDSSYVHFYLIKQKLYEFQYDVLSEKVVAYMYNFNSDKYCIDFCIEYEESKKELTIKFGKRFCPEPASILINKKNEFIDSTNDVLKHDFAKAMRHKFKNLDLDFSNNSCVGTINYIIVPNNSVMDYVNRPKEHSFNMDGVNVGYKNNK